jgi:hypothetical protein
MGERDGRWVSHARYAARVERRGVGDTAEEGAEAAEAGGQLAEIGAGVAGLGERTQLL